MWLDWVVHPALLRQGSAVVSVHVNTRSTEQQLLLLPGQPQDLLLILEIQEFHQDCPLWARFGILHATSRWVPVDCFDVQRAGVSGLGEVPVTEMSS